MKVQVTQENLARGLGIVGRVAGGRTSLPILTNVLISTDKNQLRLAATNLEIAITQLIGVKVETPGSITVPAKLISDFISSLPAGNISLEVEDSKLHIESDNYSSTINGVSAEEFPSIPTVESKEPLTIKTTNLKDTIQQTVVAASSDEARPVLTGAYLHSEDSKLYCAATDSYRLAERMVKNDFKKQVNMIIPARTLSEIQRIIDDQEELQLHYDESQIMVRSGDTELVSKLIDGKFPAYRQLIPAESEVTIKIAASELLSITKVAALFARESAGSITLEVDKDKQQVSIASVASQVGENTSTAQGKVQGSGKITLNSRFLIDALNVIHDDEVKLRFSSNSSPCILEPLGKEKGQYQHIIMPLRS
jgi:DNA polymerase III subunit beta